MKLVVLALAGAGPDLLFGDEGLATLRNVMELGSYGTLEAVAPALPEPVWAAAFTGRDPASLGIFGCGARDRLSYDAAPPLATFAGGHDAVWDLLARAGRRSILVGLEPGPAGTAEGVIHVGSAASGAAEGVVAEALRAAAAAGEGAECPMTARSRRRFAAARHLMATQPWDLCVVVDRGLVEVRAAGPEDMDEALRDYLRDVDASLGALLETLDGDAAVLVVAPQGVQPAAGGFRLNEWFARRGLLARSADGGVAWEGTTCFAEAGPAPRVHLNVRGREPRGKVAPEDYGRVRDEVTTALRALAGADGAPDALQVLLPAIAGPHAAPTVPDAVVLLDGTAVAAVDALGDGPLAVPLDARHPDARGAFVCASPAADARGEVEGAHLLDVVPTMLVLLGADAPSDLPGRSLAVGGSAELDEEALLRERLSGLGYI